MKSQKAVSQLFSGAVIGVCALMGSSAWAAQGGLMFHGSLVNAGCEAHVTSAATPVLPLKSLQAAAGVTLGLSQHDDVCHQLTVPLQASYAELRSAAQSPRAGIVTLTYQ